MKQVASREAKNRFGELLDTAQITPVRVTKKGKVVGVIMSVRHYEQLRGASLAHSILAETGFLKTAARVPAVFVVH